MKADLSRDTFDRARRYRSVRMQQGRVQLDADWNEQQDILHHRIETETGDSLGPLAVPIADPGFGLSPAGSDLAISAGRIYVEGLLCENPDATTVANQPDLPDTASPVLPAGATLLPLPPKGMLAGSINGVVVFNNAGQAVAPPEGTYLAYLETWQRHLSALEEPSLREVALGGPDTCSREKTIWQVKLLRAGDFGAPLNCLSDIAAWNSLIAAPDGRLAARAEASIPPKTPCQLPPEAGYRLLENHLYRVEIHDDGSVAGKARYKWSRDNGSLASRVVRWLDDPIANQFEVASIGRDEVLAISAGCWVEFIDDTHELLGQPGPLVPVVRTEGNVVTVDLTRRIGHALDQALFPANPRVRRWDGVAAIEPAPIPAATGWNELAQDGIELKFAPGGYRIGDYWLIPARTATAAIEWPRENGKPAFRAPAGVLRAFARLALLEFAAGAWTVKSDCRPLFPRLTELTELHYVGGDGQNVMTNPPPNTPPVVRLPSQLQVGVANGQFPVAKAQVRFTVDAGALPNGTTTQVVETGADGIAGIDWSLASDPGRPVQHASAELLVAGQAVAGRYLPVHFSAQLALASAVAYDPAGCADLLAAKAYTVQQAIDTLCKRTHGGGCCATVGPACEFETLDVALRSLIGEDRRDICICLLPGEHSLADDLNLTGSVHHRISIHGAGPASRLILKGELFQFDTFASLSLKDLTVANIGEPRSIGLLHCNRLQLSGVEFLGRSTTGNSLLRILGAGRLLIEGCLISAVAADSDGKVNFVLERVASLAPYKAAFGITASIDGSLAEAADAIAALSADERKRMADEITSLLRSNDVAHLNRRQQAALNNLRLVVGRNSTPARLGKALDQLAAALRADTPAFALALDDTDDASLVDNRLRGRITLFGESDEMPVVTPDQMKRLSAAIKAGAVTFNESGTLVLERNALQGLRISGKALKDVITTAQGSLPAWHNLQVTNNRIDSEDDHYPGVNCAFNGNTLEPQSDIGVLIATQAKIIGNFARNDFRLFVAGANPESFGNASLNVVAL